MWLNCVKTRATWRSVFFRAQKNIQDVLAFLAHIKISKRVFLFRAIFLRGELYLLSNTFLFYGDPRKLLVEKVEDTFVTSYSFYKVDSMG